MSIINPGLQIGMLKSFLFSTTATNALLLLVAGQSNAIGGGTEGSSEPAELMAAMNARGRTWDVMNNTGFLTYQPGITSGIPFPPLNVVQTDEWGPEAQFWARWLADNPVPTGYMVRRPLSGSGVRAWEAGGTAFKAMDAQVIAAKKALQAVNIKPNPIWMIWSQGEREMVGGRGEVDAYPDVLEAVFANFRAAWGVQKFAFARTARPINPQYIPDHIELIRKHQYAFVRKHPDVYMYDQDHDLNYKDGVHLDNYTMYGVGNRPYEALVNNVTIENDPMLTADSKQDHDRIPLMIKQNDPFNLSTSSDPDGSAWRMMNGLLSTTNGMHTSGLLQADTTQYYIYITPPLPRNRIREILIKFPEEFNYTPRNAIRIAGTDAIDPLDAATEWKGIRSLTDTRLGRSINYWGKGISLAGRPEVYGPTGNGWRHLRINFEGNPERQYKVLEIELHREVPAYNAVV